MKYTALMDRERGRKGRGEGERERGKRFDFERFENPVGLNCFLCGVFNLSPAEWGCAVSETARGWEDERRAGEGGRERVERERE